MSDKLIEMGVRPAHWPDYIKADIGKDGRVRWIDSRNGRQTYPSWIERNIKRVIMPEDIGEPVERCSIEDEKLCKQLRGALYIGDFDVENGVKTGDVLEMIVALKAAKHTREAKKKLDHLWRAGLVVRMGAIDLRSKRPKHQKWVFPA